ncbi:MAG: carbohydrate ABC transporter permease [Devosia sp.]|nr:carbohydrate ABC transporter permease [Devosia sp.]
MSEPTLSRPLPGRTLPGRTVQILAIGFALLWSLAPVYWMLSTSLKTELEATRLNPTLWPEAPTLDNYFGLSGKSLPFFDFFLNSVVSCLTTAVISVTIATPAAYALSRAKFKLRGTVSYAILIFRMLPMIVLLAPLYLLLLNARLLDSSFGLIVGFTTFGLPFAVWMMKSFIDAVPIEVEEAARVDGYRRWQVPFIKSSCH